MGGIAGALARGEAGRGGGPDPSAAAGEPAGHRRRREATDRSRSERHRRQLIDGALSCLEQRGLAATTVDDIAHAGGCSRATVYRVFPGGRDQVLAAVVASETSSLLSAVSAAVATAGTLGDVVVAGVLGAGRWLAGHRALGRLLGSEPEAVLPWLAFDRQDRLLDAAGQWAAPLLGRWLDHPRAVRLAEHAARIVLVYGIGGSATATVADEGWVRHLVTTYVLPGVGVDPPAPAGTVARDDRSAAPGDGGSTGDRAVAAAGAGGDACFAGTDDEGARL